MARTFDELVAEAEAAPVEGWDFSWLAGRRFTAAAHRPRLRELHEHVEAEGPFVAHSTRFLIEARRGPAGRG